MDTRELKLGAIAVVVVAGIAGLAFYIGRTTAPVKVEYEDRWHYSEREVIRWERAKEIDWSKFQSTKTVVATNVKTVVIQHPDGTTVTETIDTSLTTTEIESSEVAKVVETEKGQSDTDVVASGEIRQTVETRRPDWQVTGLVGLDFDDTSWKAGAMVERRILGGFKLGAWGMTDATVGVSAGFEF